LHHLFVVRPDGSPAELLPRPRDVAAAANAARAGRPVDRAGPPCHSDAPVLAGLSIALAVLLKEIALAFWLVAAIYQLRRTGWRDALRVAAPAAIAFLAWLAYAAWLDAGALGGALRRWLGSAAGGDTDPRLRVSATA